MVNGNRYLCVIEHSVGDIQWVKYVFLLKNTVFANDFEKIFNTTIALKILTHVSLVLLFWHFFCEALVLKNAS